jgi:hypothetical protein
MMEIPIVEKFVAREVGERRKSMWQKNDNKQETRWELRNF